MVKLKIYVISLKYSDRRKFQINQLRSLDYEFFDGISSEQINKEYYQANSCHWERKLKKTEFACYQSHKNLWSKVYTNNKPAIIFEDDAVISTDFKKIISGLEKLNFSDIDLINFENRGRKKIISKKGIEIDSGHSLRKLFHDTTGAAAYLLTPEGAKKLIDFEESSGIALADAQLFRCKNFQCYQVEPAPVFQLDMANHYGFSVKSSIIKSSVSSTYRLENNFVFRLRRIVSQLKLGLKKTYYSIVKGENRLIKTSNNIYLPKDL